MQKDQLLTCPRLSIANFWLSLAKRGFMLDLVIQALIVDVLLIIFTLLHIFNFLLALSLTFTQRTDLSISNLTECYVYFISRGCLICPYRILNSEVFFFTQMTSHPTSKWSLWQPRCTWRATVWFWPAWQRAAGHWSSNGSTMARNWHASHWSTGELSICHSCHIIPETNRHINLSLPFNKFLICGYLFRSFLISMHLFRNGGGS